MKVNKTLPSTRRAFLKGSATLLIAAFMPRLGEWPAMPALAATAVKRIYLAPDDHTDYFWSGGEAAYQQAFLTMLDYYLNKADATQSSSSDFQSRWNCDGSFWIWTYERNRSSAQFQQLISRIQDGHISFPLNALVVCLGGTPAEAVLRGMYYAGRLERRYAFRVLIAIAMENQTLPYGLGALWAGSGAKYSWKGICNCDTQVSSPGDRQYEIYWMGGPDGSKILMKWNSMLVSNQGMGGYAEARNPSAIVDYVEGATFKSRYSYSVIGAFGQGWDDLQTTDQKCVAAAQAKSNSSRRVIVSNQHDFFEDFEATYGASLSTVSCSFGNEWDLYCAALAEVSASVKRSVEKLRSAEALAALVTLQNLSFMNSRQTARDQAWMDLGLFWEHNFGMIDRSGTIVDQRIAWQRRLANEIKSYVDTLQTDAIAALGGMIAKTGVNARFFVFNPLSWTRTDVADFPYSGSTSVKVIDLDADTETPSQIVTIDGTQYLRILAQNVPAVGYKVFEIQSGQPGSFSSGAPSVNGNVISNQFYEVSVATNGAITSLIDKTRSNREFAKTINGYSINDLGGSGTGTLQAENVGPVSATLLASTSNPKVRTARITLFRSSNPNGPSRIEIRNDINQNFDTTYTWRFGFNLTSPDVWHEEVGAVIRAKLLSQGGHYSGRANNSRYDWLTLNHFADMSGGGVGVTLSNADCYFMKLGSSTSGSLDTSTSQFSVLAGGRVANGGNGLPGQGGDTHFLQRFALQTHDAYSPVTAMKFALEHQNPLVTGAVTGGSVYPETSYSLVTISNPNVLLWALKPAEEGVAAGIIARVWNLSTSSTSFSLELSSGPIVTAWHTTHLETPLESATVDGGALSADIAANQLKTFRLGTFSFDHTVYLPVILRQSGT
jgi:alpha-mannosidase